MRSGLLALAAAGLWAALPSHSNPIASFLVSDRDTVAGIEKEDWRANPDWPAPSFIRIRNASAITVVLDSLVIPPDSIVYSGNARHLQVAFATRGPGPLTPVRHFLFGWPKSNPIALAAGDSIDLGQFEIGIAFIPKVSASERRYPEGDSIIAPMTLFAGTGSIGFILKAKVKAFTYGADGIRVRTGRGRTRAAGRTVAVDGRAAPESRPAALILLK